MSGNKQGSTPNDGRISFGTRVRVTQEVMDAVAWDAAANETSIARVLGAIIEQHYVNRHAQVHSRQVRRVPARGKP